LLLLTATTSLREISMHKYTVFLLAGLAACATDPSSTGDDDGGDDAPAFTNGVSTLSGHEMAGYVDGKRGKARFNNPVSCAYRDGKVYVSDFDNGKIRVVDAETGETSTLINQQTFRKPFALAFSPDGTLFATTDKNPGGQQSMQTGSIWRIDINKKEATPIATDIGRPRGLAVLSNGKLAVSDYQNHVVSLVDPVTGTVTPLAGQWGVAGMADGVGTAAVFNIPYGLVAKDGKLIVAEYGNNRLREVSMDGNVRTLAGIGAAGFGDGAMAQAKFNKPQGMTITGSGDVYVTDLDNFRVRKITGDVSTISGDGMGGYIDSDNLLEAEFYGLEGMCAKPDGSMLFIADGGRGEAVPHNFIRSIKLQ
jgi:hypothetical protein